MRWISILLILAAFADVAHGQVLTGTSALVRVPVAYTLQDGTLQLSGGYLEGRYSTLGASSRDIATYSASLAFLPFLELGFRFNRKIGTTDALGDRMIIARLQLFDEGRHRPAVLIGVHDFVRSSSAQTNKFHSLYAVASKTFRLFWFLETASIHLGYATDVISAAGYELNGPFGGVSLGPVSGLELLLEHDGSTLNMGPRLTLFKSVQFLVAVQDLRSITGGAAFLLRLN